jgi:hypothetical protein
VAKHRVEKLIRDPLEGIWTMHRDEMQNSGRDAEIQEHRDVARAAVVIHGIRDNAQANEVYNILKAVIVDHSDHCIAVDIIAITSPQLLIEVAKDEIEHLHILAVPETGSIIYSGSPPTPPPLFQVSRHGV